MMHIMNTIIIVHNTHYEMNNKNTLLNKQKTHYKMHNNNITSCAYNPTYNMNSKNIMVDETEPLYEQVNIENEDKNPMTRDFQKSTNKDYTYHNSIRKLVILYEHLLQSRVYGRKKRNAKRIKREENNQTKRNLSQQ